ncbi:FAD-binding protein [Paracoccus sp. (in: a-proteobacteria)]|uniref:FAD-binding protein n=1 Tax=Paracoccus sp. TaxID=267 RepID=UPI00289D078C|nr:FAD-binding protein [Paracoccus sp. (in: a-proteobacteria)]
MRPESEIELAEIIRTAKFPVTPIGGASRLRPGEGQGSHIDLTGISGVTLYEPEALTLVARAGTPLAEINRILAAEGQMLAFEPDARAGSTIGGIAASNASGPRRVQVGACRDAMLGVRFVTGEGEIVKNGGRVMKNVTGYDLVKLMAGSRGTLGILTEISLKTAPIPPASRLLALRGLDPQTAIAALTEALTGPFDISAAGWLAGEGAVIRLEGLAGSVDLRSRAIGTSLARFGQITEVDPALAAQLVPSRAPVGDLWRILCLPTQAPALLKALPQPLAVDWGGGLIWVALPEGELPVLPEFQGQATRMTGQDPHDLPAMNPVVARLNDSLRAKFDPRSIFAGTSGHAGKSA